MSDVKVVAERADSTMADAAGPVYRDTLAQLAVPIVYAILSLIAIYPVLVVDIPPLTDYPAHLAGIHIQTTVANDPDLAKNYTLHWQPIPNLAMEIVVPWLMSAMSLFDAGRVFVAAAILLPVAGTAVLRRALYGRVGYAPAFAFLPAYNAALTIGLLNFLVGSGLGLMIFAGWISCQHWRVAARIAVFSGAATLLYFTHLMAFGSYALLVAAYALQPVLASPRWVTRGNLAHLAVGAAQFTIPALLLLPSLASGSASFTHFGGSASRLRVLISPVLSTASMYDVLTLTLGATALYWLLRNRKLSLAPEIRLPLAIVVVVAALIPEALMQTWAVNMRLPAVAILMLLAGGQIGSLAGRWRLALTFAFATLFVLRVWDVANVWTDDARKFAELRQAGQVIPTGARILPVQPRIEDTPELRGGFPQAYWTVSALLTIDRAAFVPLVFTIPDKHLVAATQENFLIDTPYGEPVTPGDLVAGAHRSKRGAMPLVYPKGTREYWTDWPHRFDYVVVTTAVAPAAGLAPLLAPVYNGSFFAIYRIVPGSCDSGAAREDAALVCTPDG